MELHRKRYLILSVVIFTLVFLFHLWNLLFGWSLRAHGIDVPPLIGVLAVVATGSMAFMGVFYLLKK